MPGGKIAGPPVIMLLVMAILALVVASPWALRWLGGNGMDWRRLSDVGQTYGAASAVVAAIALAGVISSIVIQLREVRANRKNAQRVQHADLLRLAMTDPRYMECWGPFLTDSFEAESQFTYVNLIVTQWHAQYVLGEAGGDLLRATASSVFLSKPGRAYWESAGTFWRDNYPDRRSQKFYRILDETYREALKEPVSVPPGQEPERDGGRRNAVLAAAAVVGAGLAAGIALRSIHRRARPHR